MKTPTKDTRPTAKLQIEALNRSKAADLDTIVEGVADLTAGGTPVDPADLNDLVDQVLA